MIIRALHRTLVVAALVLAAAPAAVAAPAPSEASLGDLLYQAETLLRLGVVEKGATRSFEEASSVLEKAEEQLVEADFSSEERRRLALEIEAVQQDLEVLSELYEERFYGVFPLARLTIPTLLAEEGFAVTEQLFHAPDVAAVEVATRNLLAQLNGLHHPHVVLRSSAAERASEYLVWDALVRDGRTTAHTRREVVAHLNAQELEALDRGEIDQEVVDRLIAAFDAVNLMVLTVSEPTKTYDAHVARLRRSLFTPGEVVQGGPVDATLVLCTESSQYLGFARDRRAQFWPIIGTQVLLFALTLVWATRIPWSVGQPLKIFQRLLVGATLFASGRVFIVLTVIVLREVPESSALAIAAWWWPALLGLLAVLGGGLVAWIAQAQLTNVVPGARGARAVSSIFALVAMGTSSYFVAPLLLLEESRGFASLVPFVLASVSLAVIFGFAARTGPPVPHYFAIGPLVLAPVLGACLLMISPRALWVMVGWSAALCLAARVRHRHCLAHGTEEPEPSPEEAATADQKRLARLGKKLLKK